MSSLRRLRHRMAHRMRHSARVHAWWQWGSVTMIVVGALLTVWAVWKAVTVT